MVILSIGSCRRDDVYTSSEELYSLILTKKAFFEENLCTTKAVINNLSRSNEIVKSEISDSDVPDWMLKYINIYSESDDISSWDEKSICKILSMDKSLSANQKKDVAGIIAYGFYFKDDCLIGISSRKGSHDEYCLKQYKKACKVAILRGLKDAAFGIGGGIIGIEVAIIAGEVNVLFDLRDIRDDFMRCLADF